MNLIYNQLPFYYNITRQLYYEQSKHCLSKIPLQWFTVILPHTQSFSHTHTHTHTERKSELWVPVNQNPEDHASHLWMALVPLHNQAILSIKSTSLRQSLWMKVAAEANGLLRLIGYSESLCMCNPKIKNPSDALFIFSCTQKDQRQLQLASSKHPSLSSRLMWPGTHRFRMTLIKL